MPSITTRARNGINQRLLVCQIWVVNHLRKAIRMVHQSVDDAIDLDHAVPDAIGAIWAAHTLNGKHDQVG